MTRIANVGSRLVSNTQIGPRLWSLVLEAPYIASTIRPGQFVHLKVADMQANILRRPFSIYSAHPEQGTVEIVYQTVGFGTEFMTSLDKRAKLEMIGPVGNVWSAAGYPDATESGRRRVLLVGGGVGAAPLNLLAERLERRGHLVDIVLGAQTKSALTTRERYEELFGGQVFCATDDGTFGTAGFCTSLVEERLASGFSLDGGPYDSVCVCGPEPLMRLVARMCAEAGVPCEVSLEKRMACGVGACLSCVVDTVDGKKRSCVDGPVFDAEKVVW